MDNKLYNQGKDIRNETGSLIKSPFCVPIVMLNVAEIAT